MGPDAGGKQISDTRHSRFLSLVLRHKPETIGVRLDEAGWIDITELLTAMAAHGRRLDRARLMRIVAESDKQRFEVQGSRIRAAQGHTVDVELGLEPQVPPEVLYHGTVPASLPRILAEGLRPMGRRHVHLSPDVATATKVGRRRGTPVVLPVDAAGAHAAGAVFYRSANGVWLTDAVAPAFLGPPQFG